jgi:hypothetical protein
VPYRKMLRLVPVARDAEQLVNPAHWHSSSSEEMALMATLPRMVNLDMRM